MNVSEKGIAFIKDAEGFRAKAYQDGGGVWTIGYGSTHLAGRPVQKDDEITDVQAEFELRQTLRANDAILLAKMHELSQPRYDAVSALVYNIGLSAFLGSTLLRLINQGNFVGASNEFPKWDHDNGVVVPGLLSRRLREQSIFNS